MKAFTLVTLLVASCTAYPHGSISSQYHAQDGHEGFSYGYSDENSQKHETKVHGLTSGAYMYKDGSGHTQSVQYVADPKDGFKIVSASNLPKAPVVKEQKVEDTKAVKEAKAAHFAAVAEAEKHASDDEHYEHHNHEEHDYEPVTLVKGLPVDTEAVEHAKAEHFAAIAEAGKHASADEHYEHHHHEKHDYEPVTLVKGLPVDTEAVEHAKAVHFAAIAEAAKHVSHDEYEEPSHDYIHKHEYASVTLHKGLPVDTPAVKEAKAIHFAAIAEAKAHHVHRRSAPFSYSSVAYHPQADKAAPIHVKASKEDEHLSKSDEHDIKYDGKYGFHIPVIKDGVPEDTHAVQHAKAEHFEAIAKAAVHDDSHHSDEDHHDYHHEEVKADDHTSYDGSLGYHVPVLTKQGVPEDTHAVKHAKAEHFEAIAKVESHPSYAHWEEKEKAVEKQHGGDEHHHW